MSKLVADLEFLRSMIKLSWSCSEKFNSLMLREVRQCDYSINKERGCLMWIDEGSSNNSLSLMIRVVIV